MNETLSKLKDYLQRFPQPLRYILSGIIGAVLGIAMLCSCTSCGTAAFLRTTSNGTITITNSPSTDANIDINPNIN